MFRSKVLEVHYHDTVSENSDEELGGGSHCVRVSLEGAPLNREPDSVCHGEEEEQEQDAISILKKHSGFMEKQTLIAEHYKRSKELARTVSSKRLIDDSLASGESARDKRGKWKMTKTQAEKNRKRKLKKKKAKINKNGVHV